MAKKKTKGAPKSSGAAAASAKGSGAPAAAALGRVRARVPVGDDARVDVHEPTHAAEPLLVRLAGILSPAGCATAVAAAEACDDWASTPDSVDGEPEWQHTIVDAASGRRTGESALAALVAEVGAVVEAHALAPPQSKGGLGLDTRRLYVHWAFVRSYEARKRRTAFAVHRDSSVATMNLLLTDPGEFEGAELYVLDPSLGAVDALPPKALKRAFPDALLRAKHSVPQTQGGALVHLGKRAHGVLPIESGRRHTLILMWYEKR